MGIKFKKFKSNRRAIPTEYKGILFDSQTEAEYYQHLERDKSIERIELQPKYKIIEPYKVLCRRCEGSGKVLNGRTLNQNKCRVCNGEGLKTKAGAVYTADFKVTYKDGYSEVIDVKGGPVGRDFGLRTKLLESKTGNEVVVVRLIKKEWVRQ